MSDEEKAALRNQLAKEYPNHFTPQYDRTIGGHALEFAKGIPRGFLSSLVSAGEGAVNLFDVGNDSALSEGLRGIQQNIQDSALGPDEAYQDAYSSMLGQGLGSFATFMTPGAIARGVGLAGKTAAQIPSLRGISNVRGLGTTLSTGRARSIEELGALSLAVPMGISEQGQRLEQARLRGEEVGAGKEFIAELAGAGIGMSELLPIERAWRRFGKANMGRFDLGEATKAALVQAGVEGTQEAGAGIMQNLTAKNLYDPELAITDSALDEASVGGGVGFISSFLMSAFGARRFAKNRLDEVDRREQLNEADSKPIASKPEDLNPTTSTALVPIDHYDTLDNLIKKQQAIATENEINEAKDRLAFELATNNPYFEVVETQDGYDVVNTRNNEVQSSTTDINEAFVTKQQLNETSNKLRADQATQELLRINGLVGSGAAESMARNILNPETSQIPKQVLANYDSRITDEMVKEARIVLGEIKGRGGKPPARTIDPASPRASGALQVWRKNLRRRKIQEKDFYTPAEAKKLLKAKDFNDLMEDIANTSDRQYEKYRVAADDTSAVEERLPPLVDGQRSWSIPNKITEKTFKDLAKEKNIRLDINSKAFQNFLETYTGERSFSKLSKAQKKMAYAKFSRIPSFAKGTVGNEVPPVPLPNFAPRPYTFEQYDAVYKNSLERPNQVVSPKSIMDLTGLDRESATEMFEDFVESGRLAPQERIIQQMGYFTPQGRMFNRRGAPYKEAEMRFTKKQTYKGKWIPRDVAELESEYVYDLTATKGESVEDYAQRLTNMGVAPEVINDLVESETVRQAEIEANKNRIISPAGKDITEKVLEEKEIKQKLEERIERFEKELKKVAKSLNIPDRVTVKLVKEINKQRDQGTWEATKRDYRDPSGRILISVGEAMVDGDGNPLTEEQTIINLARTLHHEGIHAFRDLDLFTDREFNILKKFTERVRVPESVSQEAFNNNLSFNDLAKRTYSDLDADSQNEEAVAMLFEYWSQDKSIATGKPRNILQRIADFIRSIVYSTNVAGFRSPIDILQDVESGVIGARKVGEVRSLRELDRAAALGIDLQAAQAEEVDKELDVGATLDAATARASRAATATDPAYMDMPRSYINSITEEGADFTRDSNGELAEVPKWHFTRMPIDVFLKLTTSSDSHIDEITMKASKLGRFDPAKEDSGAIIGGYPYLRIDDNGKVRTHEGRHRASLLKASGATTIPVSIEGNNKDVINPNNKSPSEHTLQDMGILELKGEMRDDYSFPIGALNIVPVIRGDNNRGLRAEQLQNAYAVIEAPDIIDQLTTRASRRIDDAPLVVAETKSGEARGFIPDDVNVSKDAWSELQDRTFDTILTPEGNVKFLENIGIDHNLQEGFGSFGNDINKNFNITLPESSYEEAQAVASVMGHALMQDSVVTGFLQPSGTNRTLVLTKQDNSDFNIDEINQINELLKPLSREAVWGEENVDFTAMDNAIFIGDPESWTLDFDSYTPEQLQSFRRIIRPIADTMGLNLNSVNLNTELVENANEGYREKATRLGDKAFAEGSSSIQEAAIRDLYEPSWKAYQNFIQEIGSNYEVASPLDQDGNILDTIRASRRIKDTPTLTEQQQQELYDKAENNVKSTSRGAIPLWNLNADPYATAVGYKYAEKYNVEGFGEGKTIEEVIDESMDDPIVTRASRRVDTAKWESEYEILKNVSYGKENPKPSVSNNQDLTAFQSVLKNIFPNTNIDQQFERFRQKFIYQYQAIARGEKEAQEATGVKYEADASATSWMAFSDRARGLMAEMLVKGGIVLKQTTNGAQAVVVDNAEMKTMNGEKIEGGLIGALARLHSYGRQANIPIEEYAKAYSIVQRGIRLKSEGIATPVTDEMIKKADQMVKQYPIIKEFYDNYQTFNNSLVQFAIDTGILDEKLGQEWKEQSDYYPFYRHFEEDERYDGPSTGGRMLGKSPFDVEIEGSGAPVNVDMLEAITRNSMALLNRAMRNQALKFVARDAVNAGNAVQLKEKPNKIGKDVIWYQDGGQGEEVWFRVNDPMLLESLIGYGVSPYRGIENTLAMPAGLLRDMITRSPDFVIVNMMRDTLSAYVTSGAEMTPVVDTAKNFFTASGNDVFEKLKEMAVVGGYDFSNDPKDVAKYIKQQVYKLEEGLTVRSGFRTVWDALGQMTTKSDAATRIAVYQDVYKKVYNRKVAEGVSEQEAEIVAETEAAYQALEVINFSRRGNSPFFKVYTAAVPFLNARIQGLDVLYRSASGQYASDRLTLTPAQIQQNMLLRLGSLGMITALYYAMVSDTEEYKNARREVRDDNWIIPVADDFAIKIPIPFEVGVIAKVFPERLMDGLMGESTARDVIESMNRQLATSLAFPALPIGGQFEPSMGIQAIAPLVDAIMNHDSYTKKAIVPYYMEEGLEAGYQSQYSTNEMARLIGEFFNISPMKVQYVMQGYGGSMGSYALSAVDAITRAVTDRDFIPPSADRMPVMRRFVQTSRGGGLQQQFYDLRGEVNQVVQTLNRLEKEGRTEEYIAYRESHADILNTRKAVLSIDRYMKNWREKRDKVVMSKTLSPTVKAQLIKQLENERDRRLAVVPVIKDKANIPFADFNL